MGWIVRGTLSDWLFSIYYSIIYTSIRTIHKIMRLADTHKRHIRSCSSPGGLMLYITQSSSAKGCFILPLPDKSIHSLLSTSSESINLHSFIPTFILQIRKSIQHRTGTDRLNVQQITRRKAKSLDWTLAETESANLLPIHPTTIRRWSFPPHWRNSTVRSLVLLLHDRPGSLL